MTLYLLNLGLTSLAKSVAGTAWCDEAPVLERIASGEDSWQRSLLMSDYSEWDNIDDYLPWAQYLNCYFLVGVGVYACNS